MKIEEARKLMDDARKLLYRVHYEERDGCLLVTRYVPDGHGESVAFFESLGDAWSFAHEWSEYGGGRFVNIYPVSSDWRPVDNRILRRHPA